MRDYLLSIGIMTGNSLDGADVVLSRFDLNGQILDLCAHSLASEKSLTLRLRDLRAVVNSCEGKVDKVEGVYNQQCQGADTLDKLHTDYLTFVAKAVSELIQKAKSDHPLSSKYDLNKIDLVGFHGQTCAHRPPSIARGSANSDLYTVQLGDGQKLANLLGITVVHDFRSDDLINGGEAAPLAPLHHMHLASSIKKGPGALAFCNGGNTSNISVVSTFNDSKKPYLAGWDAGPFNHFPDFLMRSETSESCDEDGKIGAQGRVDVDYLKQLFDSAVGTSSGENFLLRPPPKSSDPQWYKLPTSEKDLSFPDRLRTAECFSAYCLAWSLTFVPDSIVMPSIFVLCGGGWKNPIVKKHFAELLHGGSSETPILGIHQDQFHKISKRIGQSSNGVISEESDFWGINSTAMEARIFADAAVCRVKGEPFSVPATTNCKAETILGVISMPQANLLNASDALKDWLKHFQHTNIVKQNLPKDPRWSRASLGQ